VEIADSIVQSGRETLEKVGCRTFHRIIDLHFSRKAIDLIESTKKWDAKVSLPEKPAFLKSIIDVIRSFTVIPTVSLCQYHLSGFQALYTNENPVTYLVKPKKKPSRWEMKWRRQSQQ